MASVGAGAAVAKPSSLFRRLARRWRQRIIILPYLGYGTARRLTVCGRVLEDEGFLPSADTDTRWRNLVRFYKRLESDEVPGARLRATYLGTSVEGATDAEGYFKLVLETRGRTGPGEWQEVELELLAPSPATAIARVLVPSRRARFGVISDIDDTIVWSNVTNKLKMVLNVALTNARTRKPFKGVGAFYRALYGNVNPIFYVSKSPWNLYEPIVEYLEVQGLPLGPLMLRDFGLRPQKSHKEKAIAGILDTYPRMKFLLIGDSGEQDPEIYADVVRRYRDRIRAIYIRSVNPDPMRIAAVERLVQEVAKTGCQLVLAPDSEFAAAHAAAEGLIQASDLRAVRSEKIAEESSASNPAVSIAALK